MRHILDAAYIQCQGQHRIAFCMPRFDEAEHHLRNQSRCRRTLETMLSRGKGKPASLIFGKVADF